MPGPRPLSRVVPAVASQALGKKGQAFGALLGDWGTVMGSDLAARAVPVKLTFPAGRREGATLLVRALGPAALEIQHAEPQLVERINGFFGYGAVARLKIVQAAPPPRPARRIRPVPAAEDDRIRKAAAKVEDEGLRDALVRLGQAIASRGDR
ncbi:DUF721 domain-containing protein [Arenibaculum pallidiluteum]|uniref:DUF721 domain-containing protein n=1 Tax=Arenibaculum pallidiluteum TaxID=2812559 RepID=UPI001A97BCAE|nr:DciA family protein [Arenibaculum pallidiluteum]